MTTAYDYVDESGVLLYQNIRVDEPGKSKRFYYRHPGSNGELLNGLDGVRRVPYRLPRLLDGIANGETIWLAEGEKDVASLESLGLYATSTKNVKAWNLGTYLAGANELAILYDADRSGRQIRDEAVEALRTVCENVRVVDLVPDDSAREDGYDISDWVAEGHTKEELLALLASSASDLQPDVEDGAALLVDMSTFIQDYIVLPRAAADILSVFVLHEHALDAFETTPYILISSAEKRSGKSHLLDLLKLLLARPWKTVRITVAQLVREIGDNRSTLLLDEAETVFGHKGDRDPSAAAIRGVIDAGFEIDGEASLTVPVGRGWHVQRISVFGCKVFASIDQEPVPDTIRDRGIPVRLKRRTKDAKIQRFYRRVVKPLATSLRERSAAWAEAHLEQLRGSRPVVMTELSDRAFDVVEPLLAIADLVGGTWPQRVRDAIAELMLGEVAPDDSIGVGLLGDIRRVAEAISMASAGEDGLLNCDGMTEDAIHSAALVKRLAELDEPSQDWPAYLHGKSITVNWLAKNLKRYREFGIKSEQIKIGGVNRRGYRFAVFEEAWGALCPPSPAYNATSATPQDSGGIEARLRPLPTDQSSMWPSGASSNRTCEVAAVASGGDGNGAELEGDDQGQDYDVFDVDDPDFVANVLTWRDGRPAVDESI